MTLTSDDIDLKRLILVIGRAPEKAELALCLHEKLAQVPPQLCVIQHRSGSVLADLRREHWPDAASPKPHDLAPEIALVQQIRGVPK